MLYPGSYIRVGLVITWAALTAISVTNQLARRAVSVTGFQSAANAAEQKGTSDRKKAAIKKSAQSGDDLLEKTFSFRGWLGESAVVRREELLKNGDMRTSFFLLRPNKSWTRLRVNPGRGNDHDDPPGLQEGRVLISDYVRKSERPAITFQFAADPKQIRALQESISDSLQPKPVSPVPATLTISMESPKSGRVTLWKQTRAITTTVGESGMVYRPPDLRSAILSPNESALLFELIANDKSEYFVVSMRPFPAR